MNKPKPEGFYTGLYADIDEAIKDEELHAVYGCPPDGKMCDACELEAAGGSEFDEKYVSPYRRPDPVHREVVCIECNLPSVRGLNPLRSMAGFMRHDVCPAEPEVILELVKQNRERFKEDVKRQRSVVGERGR